MINGFEEVVRTIKYEIERFDMYDVTWDEFEASIHWAFNKLAKENGEPSINWEEE